MPHLDLTFAGFAARMAPVLVVVLVVEYVGLRLLFRRDLAAPSRPGQADDVALPVVPAAVVAAMLAGFAATSPFGVVRRDAGSATRTGGPLLHATASSRHTRRVCRDIPPICGARAYSRNRTSSAKRSRFATRPSAFSWMFRRSATRTFRSMR